MLLEDNKMADECTAKAEELVKSKRMREMTEGQLAQVASCAPRFIDREIAIRELSDKTGEQLNALRDKLVKEIKSESALVSSKEERGEESPVEEEEPEETEDAGEQEEETVGEETAGEETSPEEEKTDEPEEQPEEEPEPEPEPEEEEPDAEEERQEEEQIQDEEN